MYREKKVLSLSFLLFSFFFLGGDDDAGLFLPVVIVPCSGVIFTFR